MRFATPDRAPMSITREIEDSSLPAIESWCARLIIWISVSLHAIALFNAAPLQSANDRSRWCTVWSLVERGTFQIDEIRRAPGWDSIDIIYDDGHFYSTKPPLLTVIVAGVTWCVQRATGLSLFRDVHAVTTIVLLIVNIIPFAVSLILFSRLLRRIAATSWCRLLVLAAAAFGTLTTPFLMTLNNHTVAIAGVVLCLFALERVLSEEWPPAWSFVLCGFAAGWVCANELPAAAFGLATFALCLRRSVRQTLCWYAPAALAPLAAFFATNVIATGSWKPTYASFGSSKYNFVIDGVPSYWMDPDGIDRNVDSPAVYFLHSMIGHHGIFSLTPLFVLMIGSWIISARLHNKPLRTIVRLGAMLTVVVIGFYMTRFDNYNYGGVSCGLRWALWLIPFWLLSIVPIVDACASYRALRLIPLGLLAISMVSAWLPIQSPWQQPWLFKVMEARGWIDYTRHPPDLPQTLWTWFATIPAADSPQEASWIEFQSQLADGTLRRRKLACHGTQEPDLVDIDVFEATGDGPYEASRKFRINVRRFRQGGSTAEFVSWPDSSTTLSQKLSDFTFVRGLPLKREYRAGKFRYLHLPLRRDAFRCQLAAAAVDFPVESPTSQYRCDTWLCEELPFGVAQYELRITDRETASILHQERWTVTACNPPPAATAPPPLPTK